MKTCLTSIRLAIAGFVLPFLFLYRPALLLQGAWYETVWAVAMVVGFLLMFIIAFEDFFMIRTTKMERLLAAVASVCYLLPVMAFDFVGIALSAVVLITHITRYRKQTSTGIEAV